jgi:hypothetical protein
MQNIEQCPKIFTGLRPITIFSEFFISWSVSNSLYICTVAFQFRPDAGLPLKVIDRMSEKRFGTSLPNSLHFNLIMCKFL